MSDSRYLYDPAWAQERARLAGRVGAAGRAAAIDLDVRLVEPSCTPGGPVVVEDYDWTAFGFDPTDEYEQRVTAGVLAFMASAGFDPTFGRRLAALFSA